MTNLKSQIKELTEKNNLLQHELNEYKNSLGKNVKDILNEMNKIKQCNIPQGNDLQPNNNKIILEEAKELLRVSNNEEIIPAIRIGLNFSIKEEVS